MKQHAQQVTGLNMIIYDLVNRNLIDRLFNRKSKTYKLLLKNLKK